jgi:penicillin-binding protein 1B
MVSPTPPTASKAKAKPASRPKFGTNWSDRKRRWIRRGVIALAAVAVLTSAVAGYFYVYFSRMIDARLAGNIERTDPRLFARPFELHRGQSMTITQIVDRLNDLGYTHRAHSTEPGEFTVGRDAVVIVPREGKNKGEAVRFVFGGRPAAKGTEPATITAVEIPASKKTLDRVTLESPMITALVTSAREKRRDVPLASIPRHMVEAVLAIEDHRFYEHSGIDPIGTAGAIFRNVFGHKEYLAGGSTVTQQLVKNTFLTAEKTPTRKMTEWFMAIALERRLSKDKILELYLNDVSLGQRGSFAIHGVGEASRLFFGKDVSNVTLAEAATIAGVIQSPSRLSPFRNPDRARERRNVVLRAMADAGYVSAEAAERTIKEPMLMAARALDAEAPYFVDHVGQELQERFRTVATGAIDVHTTLDIHLQRIAHEAIRDGVARVDEILAKRKPRHAQAALIAIDPKTGDILALVGGRSYNQSQFNRATTARRQPGSVFKPFVYLAAFEHALAEGRTDVTPASVVIDEPSTFTFNDQVWTPSNYEGEYDGEITLRRALALSRNVATIRVAEAAGYGEVAALWKRVGAGTPPRPYPSIALGVFEATPFEIATAYTIFPNHGAIRPLRAITKIVKDGKEVDVPVAQEKQIARADTTFLVTNMMRSVLNEGTGAGARSAGFALDAAGKTGTTNDLRDAWFVGFTPELLTVVWVGLDDNQPVGLSGSMAALPIWTAFMKRALAGAANRSFDVPGGIVFVDIDRDTGRLAAGACPRIFREAFIAGSEPREVCYLHSF